MNTIKGLKIKHNLKNKYLSELLNISEQSFSKKINKKNNFNEKELLILYKEFNLTPNELVEILQERNEEWKNKK